MDTRELLSQVWGERCERFVEQAQMGRLETSLTIAAPLERIRPVSITDDMLREVCASLNLGLEQVALVEEQDEGGICQQLVRDD